LHCDFALPSNPRTSLASRNPRLSPLYVRVSLKPGRWPGCMPPTGTIVSPTKSKRFTGRPATSVRDYVARHDEIFRRSAVASTGAERVYKASFMTGGSRP